MPEKLRFHSCNREMGVPGLAHACHMADEGPRFLPPYAAALAPAALFLSVLREQRGVGGTGRVWTSEVTPGSTRQSVRTAQGSGLEVAPDASVHTALQRAQSPGRTSVRIAEGVVTWPHLGARGRGVPWGGSRWSQPCLLLFSSA